MDDLKELTLMNDFVDSLTADNVHELQDLLRIPYAIIEKSKNNPLDFILSLKNDFKEFQPALFQEALHSIGREDLIAIASEVSWMNISSSDRETESEATETIESFVALLRSQVETKQWKLIVSTLLGGKSTSEIDFETGFRMSIEGELITPDLSRLRGMMGALGRVDLVEKMGKYIPVFRDMEKTEFQIQLLDELESDDKEEHQNWGNRLKEFVKQQNESVYIHFDDKESVSLDYIFTPLTVVREEIMQLKANEETSLDEIAFLRSMNKPEKSLKVIKFIETMSNLESKNPSIMCLIGNPGCGKTFLCKYIALQYGNNEHTNFQYVITTQCRSEEWHEMEKSREEKEEKITSHFVRKFIAKTLPITAKWSESLSKHLVKTDGEGLLLILDGVDEFTKEVPFKSTLLYSLLQRRILTRSTVLLTSRPGAWNELREEHGQELKIDSNYQVLGFSPSDRDSYFKKRISTEDKLKDTKALFFRHDEINQLSLVPVNASLFTSLFNATNNILSQTLTQLYTALIVYIIRRQLSRMGLKRLTRVERMAQFHPSILECIGCIGEEAYEGIFHRELSCREEDISIRVDSSDHKTERLGLMQVQVKVLKLGQRVNVWTFAHLTLQEYMSAVYISNKKWVMQCVIIRFIVSSEEVFAMYKMVVRFLCGLLTDRAACLIPIICRHIIPDTMSMTGLAMLHQLYYLTNLIEVSDWLKFSEMYLLICTIIVETNSRLMKSYFSCLSSSLPDHLYFYFFNSISPNEWHCFMQSLKYICRMEILFIWTDLINPIQFSSLLHQLSSCSLRYLALHFVRQDYHTIQSYTSLLVSVDITIHYKISIALVLCELTESQPSSPLFPTTNNKWTGSIKLNQSVISHGILTNLTNQFSRIENLYYAPKSDDSDWSILLPLLSNNSRIKGLHIRDLNSYLPVTPDILSGLSSLEELEWSKEDSYTVLHHLLTNNSLSSLALYSLQQPPLRENYKHQLIELISNNRTTLRDIDISYVHTVGLNSWTSILSPIQSCCNLVSLALSYSPFSSDDISYWDTAILCLQSLVLLGLLAIPLRDTGLMTLCKSLNRHPAIRRLRITKCELTSNSCEPIKMLIHTLPYLRLLALHKPELSLPDTNPLQLLQQTAELFSVEVEFY